MSSPWRTTQIVTGFRRPPLRLMDAISSSSAAPILLSSSLIHAVIDAPPSSELDQDLDRFAFVHRPVAVRHLVEAHDPIEDSTRFDEAFEDVREELLDVRAARCGSTADGDVVVKCRLRRRQRLVLGDADAADCASRTGDAESRPHRLLESDAFEDSVDAEAAGELAHALNRLVASLADDVRCAEPPRQCDSVGMAAQDDDLLGAEAAGGNHTAQADGAVSDNSRCLPRANFGDDSRMMARPHHV